MRKFFESEPVNVIFKAPADLMEKVDDYARVTETSRSWVCRAALLMLLEQIPAPAMRNIQEIKRAQEAAE